VSLPYTLSIIKPDGVAQGNIGDILKQFEENHFQIKAIKMLRLSVQQAEGFYAVHREKNFFRDLIRYMSSGPVLVIALAATNAVERLRTLMGTTDPTKAGQGTIRQMYGTSIEKNVIHGSDSDETAQEELCYFFSNLELL